MRHNRSLLAAVVLSLSVGSVLVVASPAMAAIDGPLFACNNPVTFDTSNEDWRDMNFDNTQTLQPVGSAVFIDTDGSPDNGSVEVADSAGGWQELVSPEITSGAGSDHSFAIGKDLTFSYKPLVNPPTNNLYVALTGHNGARYYYVFESQVGALGEWVTVTVPMDASAWRTGFVFDTGPSGSAPSSQDFADVLGDLESLAISVEGSNTTGDVARVDTIVLDCSPAPQPTSGPLFACGDPVTFDSTGEQWRDRSTSTGFNVFNDYGLAAFVSDDGQGAGSVQVDDRDAQWQEVVSPEVTSGNDHRFLIDKDVTFDYKPLTALPSTDVYVAVEGNGARIFYVFASQVAQVDAWNEIAVPMNAAAWVTGFDAGTGPTGAAPSAAEFEAILGDLGTLAVSVEGQTGPDQTRFDNLAVDCPEPSPPTTPTPDPNPTPGTPDVPLAIDSGAAGSRASLAGLGVVAALMAGLGLVAARRRYS